MDYESALISRILKSPEEFHTVVDEKITKDFFVEHSALWEYLLRCFSEHGGPPPIDLVEQKYPQFEFMEFDAPISIYIEELKNRRVHNIIMEGLVEISSSLKNKDPNKALDYIKKIVIKAESDVTKNKVINVAQDIKFRIDLYEKSSKTGGITGIPTLWPILDEACQGFNEEDLIMIAARSGTGKCVSWDSEIQDPITGLIRTIEQVYQDKNSWSVLSWDRDSGIRPAYLVAKVDTGIKDCFKYTLETGRSITVTPEHPFLTPTGWVKAELLDVGDCVGIPTECSFPQNPEELPQYKIDMLAILLSEGSYTGNFVGFSSEDPIFVKTAFKASDGFGTSTNQVKSSTIDYEFVLPYKTSGRHTLNPVREYLKELGIDRTKATHKRIPDCIFRLGRDSLARFISIFWMADGYIDTAPCIVLSSEKMVRQLQHLLLRFGIQSSVRYKPVKGGFHSWRLRVYSHCWDKFRVCFSLWGDKLERLNLIIKKRNSVKSNPNIGGKKKLNYPKYPGILWVKIEDIEQVKSCKIYDLSVEDTHCFVANDILVHNTWAEVILSCHNWKQGYTPLLITREMSVWQVVRRFDAVNAQLPHKRFKAGMLTTDEYERWMASLEDMKKRSLPFYVSGDSEIVGVTGVASQIQRYRPSVVYIDGGYMLEDDRGAKADWEKFKNICQDLKRLAQREKVPIVMTHQYSKDGIDGKGSADTLKYGDVKMWFDLMIGMFQDEKMRADKEMLFKIDKIRDGEGGLTWVSSWDLDNMTFEVKPGLDDIGNSDGHGAAVEY